MTNDASIKEINILQGIRFLHIAWDEVEASTIENCFNRGLPGIHAKQSDSITVEVDADGEDDDESNSLTLPANMSFIEHVEAERDLLVIKQSYRIFLEIVCS